MTDYPTVSIKGEKNFILRAPKGEIYKLQVYTAFNKANLSVIPREKEILLVDPIYKNKPNKIPITNSKGIINDILNPSVVGNTTRGFSPLRISKSHIELSESNNKSRNIQKFEPSPSTIQNEQLNNLNNSMNQKSYVFSSNVKRFSDMKELNDKYSPGPGEYFKKTFRNFNSIYNMSTGIINSYSGNNFNKNSNRYQNCFVKHKNFSIQQPFTNLPGPGTYDLNNKQYHCKYGSFSTDARFSSKILSGCLLCDNYTNLGPGAYFKNKMNDFNNLSERWNKDNPSSFFMSSDNYMANTSQKNKLNIILEKYIDIDKEKKFQVPGVGLYNIKREFSVDDMNKNVNNYCIKKYNIGAKNRSISNSKRKVEVSKTHENKPVGMDELETEYKGDNFKKYKRELRSPFLSKSKKIVIYDNIFKKHNPGPCYYNQDLDLKNSVMRRKQLFNE